jgi:hypothetical protein
MKVRGPEGKDGAAPIHSRLRFCEREGNSKLDRVLASETEMLEKRAARSMDA